MVGPQLGKQNSYRNDCRGLDRKAASTSEMGRFETEWLTNDSDFAALVDLPGAWIAEAKSRLTKHFAPWRTPAVVG